ASSTESRQRPNLCDAEWHEPEEQDMYVMSAPFGRLSAVSHLTDALSGPELAPSRASGSSRQGLSGGSGRSPGTNPGSRPGTPGPGTTLGPDREPHREGDRDSRSADLLQRPARGGR